MVASMVKSLTDAPGSEGAPEPAIVTPPTSLIVAVA